MPATKRPASDGPGRQHEPAPTRPFEGSVADDPVIRQLLTSPEILKDVAARHVFVRERRALRQDLLTRPRQPLPGVVDAELRKRYARRRSSQAFFIRRVFAAGAGFPASGCGCEASKSTARSNICIRRPAPRTACKHTCWSRRMVAATCRRGRTIIIQALQHELQLINEARSIPFGLHMPANQALFDQAGIAIFVVADLAAIRPLYGDLGLDLAKLEAGYLSQVLVESAAAAGVGLCPIGHLHFAPLRDLFELNEDHVLVHSLVGGVPVPIENCNEQSVSDRREEFSEVASFRPGVESTSASAHTSADDVMVAVVADVWAEVLQLTDVDREANFFELGGNSFSVIDVQRRLMKRLGIDFAVTKLFQFPTVRKLSAFLAGETSAPSKTTAPALVSNDLSIANAAQNLPLETPARDRGRRAHRRLIRTQIMGWKEP